MRRSGALLPDERRRLIGERLLKDGSVSISALEAEFEVTHKRPPRRQKAPLQLCRMISRLGGEQLAV